MASVISASMCISGAFPVPTIVHHGERAQSSIKQVPKVAKRNAMDDDNKARMTSSTGGIYLDHHATTPVDKRVADAVMRLSLCTKMQESGGFVRVGHLIARISTVRFSN